ncbi:restriction endonuclease [Arcobacter sp. LA11]|uniref:restriction endonuclease n=1 Tax=Arcobacter sp. LA11 TaxID=1898176 RepID=UPI0009324943|nr:restriction endonuclease [Arcobacter sp. LA11]
MKLAKGIAILTILGATSLFATGTDNIIVLVEKINSTNDLKVKSQLMDKLDEELEIMDKDDLSEAQRIVNAKLKQSKLITK